MEIDWRFGAGCATAAFVISVLFGIIGGVQFGALVLRALLGALIFAVLGIGCHRLMKSFLPELFELSKEEKRETGETVDIVIQDDGTETRAPDDARSAESSKPFFGRNHTPSVASGEEEAEEAGEFDGLVEEMEEVSAPGAEAATVKKEPKVGEEAFANTENVDDLPDLGEMETSFATPVGEQEETVEMKRFQGSSSGGVDTLGGTGGGGQDPAHLAKVLQTILKKGKEGRGAYG